MPTWIVTDAGCDLPVEYVEKQTHFHVMPMLYRIENEEKTYAPGDEKEMQGFYQKLRDGALATTSQINQQTYYTLFKELTKNGDDVLCIPMSSGISGTVQSAYMAQRQLKEENPATRVFVEDSLCASAGQGLLAHYCLQKRNEGLDAEQLAQWVRENREHIIHWFTVDDLQFLFRGGRVNRVSAVMGSMLHIKPVLYVDREGRLIPMEKVQGRKKSLRRLAEKVIEGAEPKSGQTVFISHGGCEKDALFVRDLIKEGLPGITDFLVSPIGCVVGAHSGPGTVAIFFWGNER